MTAKRFQSLRYRRAVALACAWGLCTFLAAAQEQGGVVPPNSEPLKIILQWAPQSQFAGYYVALAKDFYRARGLDVELLKGGPDRNPDEYLVSGKAQFATTFLTGALALCDRGVPLVHLAQVINECNQMIVAWRNMDIDSVEDLDLRRISVWEGGFRPAFMAFYEAQGIHPTIVPQYYSVNLFLHRGVAACVAMEYNEYHMIYQAGVDREEMTTFRMRDYGFGVPEDGIYCLDTTFREQPEVCRAVAEASLEGWRYAAAHPDEALDIVMKYVREAHVPTNRPHMDWMLRTILATVIPELDDPWQFGELRPEDYELAVSLLKNSGVIKTAPAFDAFRGKEAPRVP